ncbi:GntR family transcriptional regulator [Virgibacillus oceani]
MKEKHSIKMYIYNTLKESILTRKLPPGKQLVENTISEKLKVSRTPIRNAINLLSTEGLVELVPNKGAFVINPTYDEIIQAYTLRKELELMATELAISHLDEEDFKDMENIIKGEKTALYKKDLKNYLKANQDFHLLIIRKCGNKFLIEFIEKLINQTSIYLILFDTFFDENSPQPYGYREHMEIVQLLRQKDIIKIREGIIKHYDNAINSLDIHEEYKELDRIFD